MGVKTTRRAALGAAIGLSLLSRRSVGAVQQLGKIETESALGMFPPLPEERADWPMSIVTYADLAGYWAARGVEQPRTFDDETAPLWLEVSQRIPLNDGILFQYINEDWDDLIGFNPMDVDQMAVAFDPPEQVRAYTGAFDPARIARQLGAAGHEVRIEGDFTVLDSASDGMDLMSDLGRLTLGNFNYLAVTDSLVIASRTRAVRDTALAIATGDESSLAETSELAELSGLLPEFQGYVVVNDAVEAEVTLPPVLYLAGFRADGDGGIVSLVADFVDPKVAGDELDRVSDQLANDMVRSAQIPYTELLGDYEIEVVPGTGLVRVSVSNPEFETRWLRFVYSGDFGYLLRA